MVVIQCCNSGTTVIIVFEEISHLLQGNNKELIVDIYCKEHLLNMYIMLYTN